MEMDLAEAVEHGSSFLLYQPTFDLQAERVIGVEALIRWGTRRAAWSSLGLRAAGGGAPA